MASVKQHSGSDMRTIKKNKLTTSNTKLIQTIKRILEYHVRENFEHVLGYFGNTNHTTRVLSDVSSVSLKR